jgi:serine/threonine protein kinase
VDSTPDLDQLAGIPATFGGYTILELVEKIGGAHVFLARQASVDRLVTLTVLPKAQREKPAYRRRFERQIDAASRLNHPNVVRAVDAGSIQDHRYIASEYAGGQRLSDTLARREWIPTRRCVNIARGIASALVHLESKRVIHRGVNPRAILLAESGAAKLRGFSLSKILEGEASQTWFDFDAYAAQYMSPEIAESARLVDTRADIYSFGCVLYHLLTGRPPFTGKYALEIMKQHVEAPAPDPREHRDDLTDSLRAVVLRCLSKSPAQRYRTAAALAEALEGPEARNSSGPTAPPDGTRLRGRGWLGKIFRTPE